MSEQFSTANMALKFTNSKSKVMTLVQCVSADIIDGSLAVGDDLPSINEMSRKHKVSRDTVFKAYRELKERGIVDSTPTKSYFVKGDINNVLLLLDTYSPFKEELYNNLIKNLPAEKYRVDVLFHQYNERLFDTIMRDSIGRYNYYIVMNLSDERFSSQLEAIPQGKLLLLDFGSFGRDDLAYVCQDFGQSFYDALSQASEKISKYKSLEIIFSEHNRHPLASAEYLKKFCGERSLPCRVSVNGIEPEEVRQGEAYICTGQRDMVSVIRGCNAAGWELGRDVGLLAYNDMPLHEVIKEGVSSVSVDFGLMGRMAAKFIESGEQVQMFLPTKLILRNSL